MPGIFNDEHRVPGPIWPNPFGTRPLCPMDVVAKSLKWSTLPRFSRLAIGQRGRAGTASMNVDRP